ncbi:MAG: ABC transporter substrate-binding protein [Elusimicrobia bacterium]|nr:ABC transporter substrate-binding protein [Elusimicrobiota bacterium]
MRRTIWTLGFLGAACASGACAFGAGAAARNDTLVSAEMGEITSFDPAYAYDALSMSLLLNVYDTLIGFKGESLSEFEPLLAAKVPSVKNGLISRDGLTYRFPMRKGVKFHDGSPVTAEDARYSTLRFMLMDRSGGPSALLLEPILGVSSTRDLSGTLKVDFGRAEKAVRVEGNDLVIKLARPFAPFMSLMARCSYVVPKAWAAGPGAASRGDWDGTAAGLPGFNNPSRPTSYLHENVNGAGPFKLERWDRTGKYAVLARHDGYWKGPAALARIMVKTVPEFSTRRLLLEGGDADIIETSRAYVASLTGLKGVRVVDGLKRLSTDPSFFFTFRINAAGNPDIGSGKLDGEGIPPDFFTDKDVRKGFARAFDYDLFLRDTFKGTAARAKGPVPPELPGYDPGQPFFVHDAKKAEDHFRKAWGGQVWEKGFRFTLSYNVGGDLREAACQLMKRNVESLNPKFRVDLRGIDWPSFLDKAQRRMLPMFSRGWEADFADAHNFVYAYYHSAGRYPSALGFSNPELDELIEAAVREVSPAKRAALYRRILAKGYDEVPAIVTVHPRGVRSMRDWVRGFYANAVHMGNYYYPMSKR